MNDSNEAICWAVVVKQPVRTAKHLLPAGGRGRVFLLRISSLFEEVDEFCIPLKWVKQEKGLAKENYKIDTPKRGDGNESEASDCCKGN